MLAKLKLQAQPDSTRISGLRLPVVDDTTVELQLNRYASPAHFETVTVGSPTLLVDSLAVPAHLTHNSWNACERATFTKTGPSAPLYDRAQNTDKLKRADHVFSFANEPVLVRFTIRNPLNLPLLVKNMRLCCEYFDDSDEDAFNSADQKAAESEDALLCSKLGDVSLEPGQSHSVCAHVVCQRTGNIHIQGVEWQIWVPSAVPNGNNQSGNNGNLAPIFDSFTVYHEFELPDEFQYSKPVRSTTLRKRTSFRSVVVSLSLIFVFLFWFLFFLFFRLFCCCSAKEQTADLQAETEHLSFGECATAYAALVCEPVPSPTTAAGTVSWRVCCSGLASGKHWRRHRPHHSAQMFAP